MEIHKAEVNPNDEKINCRELITLPELFGNGSKYDYLMFKYIWDDFNNNKFLDINKIFIEQGAYNKDVKVFLFNKKFYAFNEKELREFIHHIINNVNDTPNVYIIIPTSADINNIDASEGHAFTQIFEFNKKIFKHIYILNSGGGAYFHDSYSNDYLNYVYDIKVDYDFSSNVSINSDSNSNSDSNFNTNVIILFYLLGYFLYKYKSIEDIYYWLGIMCSNSLQNLKRDLNYIQQNKCGYYYQISDKYLLSEYLSNMNTYDGVFVNYDKDYIYE